MALLNTQNNEEDALARVNLAGISVNSSSIFKIPWFIDSGATHHIYCDLSLFKSYKSITPQLQVQLPDGSYSNVTHIGDVHFSPDFIVLDVYHIPTFSLNLISVTQLTKHLNCIAHFSCDSCTFQDHISDKIIGQGSHIAGLYLQQPFSRINSVNNAPTNLWHTRLGHPSYERFKLLCNSFGFMLFSSLFYCNVCPLAK